MLLQLIEEPLRQAGLNIKGGVALSVAEVAPALIKVNQRSVDLIGWHAGSLIKKRLLSATEVCPAVTLPAKPHSGLCAQV